MDRTLAKTRASFDRYNSSYIMHCNRTGYQSVSSKKEKSRNIESFLVLEDISEYCREISETQTETSKKYSHPALVANRLIESSLSPWDRTCPHRANVVEVFNARPSASTSTILICTEAWSFEVMRRPSEMKKLRQLAVSFFFSLARGWAFFRKSIHTCGRTLARNVEIDEYTLNQF